LVLNFRPKATVLCAFYCK